MDLLESAFSGRVRRTSHSHVVNELGKAIVGGTYPVGSILPGDSELAGRFHVSRTVLREAMKTLSAKGLIVPRARIGTRVTDSRQWNMFDADVLAWHIERGIDRDFVLHLCEMRLSFEPYAASLAAERARPDMVEKLFMLADGMAEAKSSEELIMADLQFHLAVLQASQNPFMYGVGTVIEAALIVAFGLSSPEKAPSKFERVSTSHTAIVEAIAMHDREAAANAMRQVILTGRSDALGRMAGEKTA